MFNLLMILMQSIAIASLVTSASLGNLSSAEATSSIIMVTALTATITYFFGE